MIAQILEYCTENKWITEYQYGFRPGYSTEHAALHLYNCLLNDMDKNQNPFGIFLDLSKAFDTIDHSILLKNT